MIRTDPKAKNPILKLHDAYQSLGIKPLPYSTYLSLEPLIRLVEEQNREKGCTETILTQEVLRRIENAPEIRGPIRDYSRLEKHRELLDLLLSMVLPPFTRDSTLAKISAPFDFGAIYVTPAMRDLVRDNDLSYNIEHSKDIIFVGSVIKACSLILNTYYGQDLKVDPPISITVKDVRKGISRYFKTRLDLRFVEIRKLKPLRPISQEEIHQLVSNIYDIDLWLKLIPPDHFAFHGFVLGTLIDITEEEAVSRLKYKLLSKDAIEDSSNVKQLQDLLRTFFGLPDLKLGISAMDYPPDTDVPHPYKIRFELLAKKLPSLLSEANRNSIYEKAFRYKEVLLVEDLTGMPSKTQVEKDLIERGIRSIIVAPLLDKHEKVIGMLEIGSPHPYDLHSFVELKFKEIISLFSLAVERSREEMDNEVEAIIREQFTAVHPIVEWRFLEAARNLLDRRNTRDQKTAIEPIVFHNVYALYGQSDIVSSSELRNEAIKADLLANLRIVKRTIRQCLSELPFPLLDQLMLKVDNMAGEMEREYISSDETRVIDLLHQEIHPLFRNLLESQPDMAPILASYFSQLDEELGIIYRRRKAYEESVTALTTAIADYIDEQEKISQRTTPHYFEKYKTDGVEYDIYVGQSLLKHGTFCQTHFRNLRLWQLLQMVEVTRKVESMQDELPVPLETAQLIFAYNAPLSIRFRLDEKHFDVDGAYNVRYQILKKRIDKATVEGTDERLTVSGKIAVVYLHDKDRDEYLDYFDYMRHQGLIRGEVEEFVLSRMQGVQGLRALRVTVNTGTAHARKAKPAKKLSLPTAVRRKPAEKREGPKSRSPQ